MSAEEREVRIKCHNCGKTFPVAPTTDREEREQGEALIKRGEGTLRLARWCPWCRETNMVEVSVEELELVRMEVVFRGTVKGFRGLAPREGEGEERSGSWPNLRR